MVSRIAVWGLLFQFLVLVKFQTSGAQSWIQAGYWYSSSGFQVSDINSALYTHLVCAFAVVNSSSFELTLPSSDEQSFSSFTTTVKEKNPSITTILSTGGGNANYTVISTVVSDASSRKSFTQSSIRAARLYGFQSLDFSWVSANTGSDMSNMGKLFQELREAAKSEALKL